ncbi:glycosyltransferase [Longilinea arvoryzae]|uniref:Glycosyltransferase n=1 Tax=Longilinea arvoryzae TaxID=360412 RepID=A0A0S7BJE8_9CHLR|nr:glycosyltransferase family 4 protein [Longilinea arvoryzae]GAP14001.1 glycosyltransferase [Longilinea arvoryzae]
MRITLLHYAAPPVVGGVETVIAHQAQQLNRAGNSVRILAGRGETWDAQIPVRTLPLIDSRHPHILKAKASLDKGVLPDEFDELVERIKRELMEALAGCDILIAHNVLSLHKNLALTAAIFQISQENPRPRLIAWHHDPAWTSPRYLPELHDGYPWNLLRTAWPNVRQVTISEARQTELARLFQIPGENISVIPAGLDLEEFLNLHPETCTLLKKLSLANNGPILLTPVRLTRRKNIELALRTLAALKRSYPSAALIVTGPPGPHNPTNIDYFSELLSLRTALHLQESAYFLAEYFPEGLPESSVPDFYRISDLLFLPSREEGFGIPILEAGLAGIPIFCSDLSALKALAGERANYFDPDDAPPEIAARIAHYIQTHPTLQMRMHIRQHYSWEGIYQTLIAPILEELK